MKRQRRMTRAQEQYHRLRLALMQASHDVLTCDPAITWAEMPARVNEAFLSRLSEKDAGLAERRYKIQAAVDHQARTIEFRLVDRVPMTVIQGCG